jgi:hypothetical protein
MSSDAPAQTQHRPTVFLSYAREDREAAQNLRDALPTYGLEVWYDESALTGGDAWDQKIRRQIRECDFFIPIVSAHTEARLEGYFRREWRLAVERTLDMADDHTFLLPVVIDDTAEAGARVPERFLTVQWTRLPDGKPTAALEALCRRLAAGQPVALPPARRPPAPLADATAPPTAAAYPAFPREEPGQKGRFWLQVAGWGLQSAWLAFRRFPRWIRVGIYGWLCVLVLAKACTPSDRHKTVSATDAAAINQIAAQYPGSSNKADVNKLGTDIAHAITGQVGSNLPARAPVLAIPFAAPTGDTAAQTLANAAFAQMYGRVAVTHHGRVGLVDAPLPSADPSVALASGREHHSEYVLTGAVDATTPPTLVVKILEVDGGSTLWSASYPVAGTDPARVAAEVDANLQRLEND